MLHRVKNIIRIEGQSHKDFQEGGPQYLECYYEGRTGRVIPVDQWDPCAQKNSKSSNCLLESTTQNHPSTFHTQASKISNHLPQTRVWTLCQQTNPPRIQKNPKKKNDHLSLTFHNSLFFSPLPSQKTLHQRTQRNQKTQTRTQNTELHKRVFFLLFFLTVSKTRKEPNFHQQITLLSS